MFAFVFITFAALVFVFGGAFIIADMFAPDLDMDDDD